MIRLIKPYIAFDEVSKELEEVFDSGIFTKGTYSKLLPQMVADYVGAKQAFLTTSATTALTMSLKILGIGNGDEVAVSDFSFPASVNVIEDVGAIPVFVDVSLDTFNMDQEDLIGKISDKTKAVIFVDALGNPSGLDSIATICRDHSIVLIEDAACAIGSKVGGINCGAIADLTCFSLHPRKLITCGEGGVIATNNDDYIRMLAEKLNHGANESGDFITYGYNYRMPEIACLMGCNQIQRIDEIVKERRAQAEEYRQRLTIFGFKPQIETENAYHNMQSIVFVVPEEIERDALQVYLLEQGIETTIGTYCLSECTYYRKKYDAVQKKASYLQHNTITFPCYHGVPVNQVCDVIASFFKT